MGGVAPPYRYLRCWPWEKRRDLYGVDDGQQTLGWFERLRKRRKFAAGSATYEIVTQGALRPDERSVGTPVELVWRSDRVVVAGPHWWRVRQPFASRRWELCDDQDQEVGVIAFSGIGSPLVEAWLPPVLGLEAGVFVLATALRAADNAAAAASVAATATAT
jgi:hypothetical protein